VEEDPGDIFWLIALIYVFHLRKEEGCDLGRVSSRQEVPAESVRIKQQCICGGQGE
jgi:hypothetical protein